jgi:hypothetical protein
MITNKSTRNKCYRYTSANAKYSRSRITSHGQIVSTSSFDEVIYDILKPILLEKDLFIYWITCQKGTRMLLGGPPRFFYEICFKQNKDKRKGFTKRFTVDEKEYEEQY